MIELRRSTFEERFDLRDHGRNNAFRKITYNIDRTSSLPVAECYDDDVVGTLQTWVRFDEPGCCSRLVYGSTQVLFVCVCMFCHVLNLSPRVATVTIFTMQLFYAIISFVVGHHGGTQWATLLLLATGKHGQIDEDSCFIHSSVIFYASRPSISHLQSKARVELHH